MLQSVFNIGAGLLLILSGLIPSLQTQAGIISAGAAAILFGFRGTERVKSWQSLINGIISIWVLLSVLWFHLIVPRNCFISGAVLPALATWNTAEHPHPSHVALR